MDSLLVDHLKEQSLRVFLAIRVDFNSGQTLALIDGASTVRFTVDGETAVFRGNDPIYGSLAAADTVSERILEEAPRFKFTLNPTGPDGLGELSAPINQGSASGMARSTMRARLSASLNCYGLARSTR